TATVDHQVVGAIQPPAMLVGAGAAIWRDPRVELPNTAALNNLHADLRSAARRDRPQYFSRTVRLDVVVDQHPDLMAAILVASRNQHPNHVVDMLRIHLLQRDDFEKRTRQQNNFLYSRNSRLFELRLRLDIFAAQVGKIDPVDGT